MWLLHTETFQLKDFIVEAAPVYAILSHTWGDDEISFQDIQNLTVATTRKGWQKIESCCRSAREQGYTWVWIDTCCIDKHSSAELSESINSMWRYYQLAQVCYAHLVDVPPLSQELQSAGPVDGTWQVASASADEWLRRFKSSRWFTRGWTLQEFLAPRHLVFLAQDWTYITTKDSIQSLLESITTIPVKCMDGDISGPGTAVKMSWAAKRRTTRTEDMAYCLLGIFGLNMPLLYGEGRRAFKRLQLELVRISPNRSIMAWTRREPEHLSPTVRKLKPSVLADSPSCFQESHDFFGYFIRGRPAVTPVFVNNAGIRMRLRVAPLPQPSEVGLLSWPQDGDGYMLLALNCTKKGNENENVFIIGKIYETVDEKDEDGILLQRVYRAFPDRLYFGKVHHDWPSKLMYMMV